jgi:hypothetical protein
MITNKGGSVAPHRTYAAGVPHDHDVAPEDRLNAGAGGGVGEVSGGIIDDTGNGGRAEVLGSGDGDHGPGLADRLAQAGGRWARRHRRKLWTAGVVVAAAGVVVAGLTAVRELQGPPLPQVLEPGPTGTTGGNEATDPSLSIDWGLPADGRPAPAPVTIRVPLDVIFSKLPTGPHASAQIIGLSGPGLADPTDEAPTPLDIPNYGLVAEQKISTALDCTRIPLPVPTTGLGARVRVGDGGRTSTGVVPLPKLGTRLAPILQAFCSTWLAQHSLRVTSAAFTVDPGRPEAVGRITVTNTGARPARLSNDAAFGTFFVGVDGAALPLRRTERVIAANSSATLQVNLRVHDCAVDQAELPLYSTTFDLLGITATLNLGRPQADTMAYPAGFSPLGVPLTQPTAERLTALGSQLCGGWIGHFLVQPNGPVRRDQGGQRLTVPFAVRVPTPGLFAGSVAGDPFQGVGGAPEDVTLLTPPGTRMTPDGSGRAVIGTLTFRVPGTSMPCTADGLPILPLPILDLQVRAPDGLRTVPVDVNSGSSSLLTGIHGVCP